MPRDLHPGQRSELYTLDVDSGQRELIATSAELLFEAPNWTSDGEWLVINGGGKLYRVAAAGHDDLVPIDLGDIPAINNDHVVSPDARTVYVSSEDGHIYAVPVEGGSIRRVSNDHDAFTYYLHGVSPDGDTLAYIGMQRHVDGLVTTNVFTIPSAGGADVQLTDDEFADDGSEFGPDGKWIYFNSERASSTPGHAQLFRMRTDGSGTEQLTFDERVNWFPHVSPVGDRIAYVSFPPGTLGHPADVEVIVRLLEVADVAKGASTHRDLVTAFGGQGTMNVPSWDATGRRIAFVNYAAE
ncbi:biopolymer transporter Tol [Glaciihabitans sp. UYNi722]|uniref:TolB family protein n=1 Tax=Glaciihabitans sp. UYNi722 TaxID=3156344 RepID=UPI003395416A